jgi:hypothetical protein
MRFRFVRTSIVGLALCLTASQACYTYRQVPSANARLAERVRIVLTPEGTTELARFLGPNVAIAEGQLSSVNADGTMVVAVDYVQQTNGLKQPWSGEGVVSFPATYRSEVHERTFLKKQTIVAAAGLTVFVVTTAIVALRAAGALGDGTGGGTPPPP